MGRALVVVAVAALSVAAVAVQEMVISRPGTPEYHRPGCPLVKDTSDVLAMTRAQAEGRGLKPHRECDPSYVPPPPKAATVFIDGAGKHYHRETCAKLGKDRRAVTVDVAAKKHWPCTTCRPPVRPRPPSKKGAL